MSKRIIGHASPSYLTRDSLDSAVPPALGDYLWPNKLFLFSGSKFLQNTHNIGNNISGFLQNNRITNSDIKPLDFIFIVKCGARYGGTRNRNRF